MPFTIDRLPDLPVLLFVQSGSPLAAEARDIIAGLTAALDAQSEPVFLVIDAHALTLSLDDLARAAERPPAALLHHRNMRESLVVTSDGMLKLALYGLRSEAFGGINVRPFSTTDDALCYCRAQLAAGAAHPSSRALTG